MSMFKSASALVLALSLGTSATAATTENCLSEIEGAAVFAAMLPDLIDGLRDKCAAHLPASAFLVLAEYGKDPGDSFPICKA